MKDYSNIIRLYRIAGHTIKNNSKNQGKIHIIKNEFLNIMNSYNIDINVKEPSSQKGNYDEQAHLLLTALRHNNSWLSDIIINNYRDELKFGTNDKQVPLLLLLAKNHEFNTFKYFYDKYINFILYSPLGNKQFYVEDNTFNINFELSEPVKDFKRTLLHYSMRNNSSDVYDFLISEFKNDHISLNRNLYQNTILPVNNWFIGKYYNDINISNADKIYLGPNVYFQSGLNKYNTKVLKSLLDKELLTEKQISNILKLTIDYCSIISFNPRNNYSDLIEINKNFGNNKNIMTSVINTIFSKRYDKSFNNEQLSFIKTITDIHMNNKEMIECFMLNEGTSFFKDQAISWKEYEFLVKDRAISLDELARPLSHIKKNKFLRIDAILNLCNIHHNILSLDKDFEITITDMKDKLFFNKDEFKYIDAGICKSKVSKRAISLLTLMDLNALNNNHNEFISFYGNKNIFNSLYYKSNNNDSLDSITSYLKDISFISPFMLFAGEKQLQKIILNKTINHDNILKELMIIKNITYLKNEGNMNSDFLKLKEYFSILINDITTLSDTLSLSKASVQYLDNDLSSLFIDSKNNKEKVSFLFDNYDRLFEKHYLNQNITLNNKNTFATKKRI